MDYYYHHIMKIVNNNLLVGFNSKSIRLIGIIEERWVSRMNIVNKSILEDGRDRSNWKEYNKPNWKPNYAANNKKEAKLRLNVKMKDKYVRKVKTVNQDTDLQAITGNSKYAGFKVKEIVFEEKKEAVKISNLPYNLDYEKTSTKK